MFENWVTPTPAVNHHFPNEITFFGVSSHYLLILVASEVTFWLVTYGKNHHSMAATSPASVDYSPFAPVNLYQ